MCFSRFTTCTKFQQPSSNNIKVADTNFQLKNKIIMLDDSTTTVKKV